MEHTNEPTPPEWFRNMSWAWLRVRENWRRLGHPMSLALAACVGTGSYYLTSSLQQSLINLKDERISFLSDQVDAYKDRLKGQTPDEAARTIQDLRTRISDQAQKLTQLSEDMAKLQLKPARELSKSQYDKLLRVAREAGEKLQAVRFAIFGQDGEALGYARQLWNAFQESGLHPTGIDVLMAQHALSKDISIGLMKSSDEANPSGLIFLESYFESEGISFRKEVDGRLKAEEIEVIVLPQ
jgi:hypothetical protein